MKRNRIVSFLIVVSILTTVQIPSLATASAPKLTVTIQVDQVGGFVGPNFKSARLPIVIAYSDGRVMSQKNSTGSVKEMYLGQVKSSALQRQTSLFLKAIKSPKGGWGMPGVADVPSTVVSVTVNGVKLTSSVYALGFTSKAMSPESLAARSTLTKIIDSLVKLAGSHVVFVATKYEAWPLRVEPKPAGVGMANPAAVFCISQYGTLIPASQLPTPPTPTPDSSVVYCHLSNGSYVEEWAYFYSASKAGIVWPSGVPAPTASCVVVSAKPLLKLIKSSGNKQWLLPSGAMTPITWRPILPLEVGCKR